MAKSVAYKVASTIARADDHEVVIDNERFRPLPGFGRRYWVTDLGRVYSVPRRTTKGGFLRASLTGGVKGDRGKSYEYVAPIKPDGCRCTVMIHHAVAAAFLGGRPKGHVIRHIDGNYRNNCLSNLAYGTYKDNYRDAVDHGTRGGGSGRSRLSKTQALHIYQLARERRLTHKEIGRMYGVSACTVWDISTKRRYKWIHN